jgi:hypothetical protein
MVFTVKARPTFRLPRFVPPLVGLARRIHAALEAMVVRHASHNFIRTNHNVFFEDKRRIIPCMEFIIQYIREFPLNRIRIDSLSTSV